MADNHQQPQLFDNYPELRKGIRHFQLGEFPTPVHQLLKQNCSNLPGVNLQKPTIDGRYIGNGYGCKTEICTETIEMMNKNEGIQLDPTYTAKTFSAVSDFCNSPKNRSKMILYWHTYNSVDTLHLTAKEEYLKLPATLQHYFGA